MRVAESLHRTTAGESDGDWYRAAFELGGVGAALIDLDGRWLRVNPALCRMLDYTESELLARTFQDLTHPDDVAAGRDAARALVEGRLASYDVEKRYLRRDGSVVWVHLTSVLARDADGAPAHFISQVQEIGERKRMEAALQATIDLQQAIATAGHDLDRMLALVVERALQLTSSDGAVVEMVDGAELVYRAAAGTTAPYVGTRLRRETSLSGRCVAERTPLHCDDSEHDPRVDAEACRRVGARSMIVVPLRPDSADAVGVLKVTSRVPHAFGPRDTQALVALAGIIASAIANAAAFEAQRALQARLRAAMSGMTDAFLVLRAVRAPNGTIEDLAFVELNDAARAVIGLGDERVAGRTLLQVIPSSEASGFLRLCRDVLSTRARTNIEHRASHPRATVEWLRVFAFPLDGDDDTLAVIARDITARKRMEAELRAEASRDALTGLLNRRGFERGAGKRLAHAIESGRPDVLLYLDLDGFKQVNDTFGHAVGDEALRAIADVLRASTRGGDLVARLGGDEFLVYANAGPGASPGGDAAVVIERLRRTLEAHNAEQAAAGRPYAIATSIGAVSVRADDTLETLLARADAALYAEKRRR